MRFRGTVILAIVVAALAAFYLLVESPRQKRMHDTRVREAALVDLSPDQADRLIIARDSLLLEFVIRDAHWEMTAPVGDVADQSAVNRIIGSITDATVTRRLESPDDLAEYGLSPPALTIRIEGAGEPRLELRVGSYTVDRSRVYAVRNDESSVLMIPTGIRRYASLDVEDYRNKRVAEFEPAQIRSYTVHSASGDMTWWRGDDQWNARAGADTIRGDTHAIESTLSRLRNLRARWFFDPPARADRFAGDLPYISLARELPAPPIRIVFADADTVAYTKVDGEERICEVPASYLDIFAQEIDALRDRRMIRVVADSVFTIRIATPDTTATLVRTASGWGYANPAFGAMAPDRATALFAQLLALHYQRVIVERATSIDRTEAGASFVVEMRALGGRILDRVVCRRLADGTDVATGLSMRPLAEYDSMQTARIAAALRSLGTSARSLRP